MHMHEDELVDGDFNIQIFDCMLKMGVTTAIGGNCGIGPADPAQYLQRADAVGLPVNIGLFLPHGQLRGTFGEDKYSPVSESHIQKMAHRLDEGLAAGCVGLSFGLRYIPGTTSEEIRALSEVTSRHGKIVAAHMRDDAAGVFDALSELIDVGSRFGLKVQVSHIGSMAAFGQMDRLLAQVDAMCACGLDIGLDCYPYNAFCTHIGSATYDEGFLERYGVGYEAIEVTSGKYRGQRCTKEIFHEVRSAAPEVLAVAHVMREQEVDAALIHPRVLLASDGILVGGLGHPRAAGSFPRFIHTYVKQKRLLSLSEAIAKMTSLPAKRIGIDKGHLSVGADADITIFHYEALKDTADFSNPLSAPQGVIWVLIGGEIAIQDGVVLNNKRGRAVRV